VWKCYLELREATPNAKTDTVLYWLENKIIEINEK
jgi:hypothetical protein